MGRIRADKNKPYSNYIVSTKESMMHILKNINGKIRLKVPSFKEACALYNIDYIEPVYKIDRGDSYLAGLVDASGSIVFNYANNRIECCLEFEHNEYTSKLDFSETIFNCTPRCKTNINKLKKRTRPLISFKFQKVNDMPFVYQYFMSNRLYSDMKFYRVTKIKYFILIRDYKNSPQDSVEHKIYYNFLIN